MTRYFEHDGHIYGVLDGQEGIIKEEWVEISEEEVLLAQQPSAEQLRAIETQQAKAERAAAMLSGGSYTIDGTEYQISFTADDGNGVTQVKAAFELGLPDTTIYFSNGTKMPITSAEFGAFAAWFVQKRNEFFV